MTYTLAILQVDPASFEDIKRRVQKIDAESGGQYGHMFVPGDMIDLTHIAIQADPDLPVSDAPRGLSARQASYLLSCMKRGAPARAKAGELTGQEALEIEETLRSFGGELAVDFT